MATTDAETSLLESAKAGDHKAFIALVAGYDDALRSVVYSVVRNRDHMDDVLQEAYTKAYTSLHSFDGRSSAKTWLYRIAYNTAVDHLRKHSRVTSIVASTAEHSVNLDSSHESDTVMRTDIMNALAALTPSHRAAVWLVDVQGNDYPTAAEILGVPPGTVASRLSHARRLLRRALGTYMQDSQQ